MVEAKWSGSYPCLCCGKWTLKVNGEDVSDKIPKDLRDSSMYTYGSYRRWHFENWLEVFENYESGLECDDWVEENKKWLNEIATDLDIQREIYHAINEQDFRSGSCGGCI